MSKVSFLKIAALLLFISFLVYGNSLFNQFVWDDHYLIERNPYIKDFKYIKEIFLSDVGMVSSARVFLGAGTYRPVSMLTFLFDYRVWKLNPLGYHLFNVLLHSLNTILLFMLFKSISNDTKISFFSVLIFALHPIHTEVVSVISNRQDLLASFFMVISFIVYIKTYALKKTRYLFMSSIFFLLSLLSKENAIIFVFLLMAYDYYFLGDYNIKIILKRFHFYLPYFFVILLYLTLRKMFISKELALGIWSHSAFLSAPFYLKVLTTFQIIASYIKLLLFPVNLSAMYLLTVARLDIITIFSTGLVLGLMVLAYFLKKRNKLVSFFIVFFFITIVPFSLVIPFGARFNDRFLYLPSIGFCFIIGYFLKVLFSKVNKASLGIVRLKTLVVLILICLLSFYAYQTIKRNYSWRTDLLLWQKTVSSCPNCARAHTNLGYAYKDIKLYDKALEEFNKSLSLSPNEYRTYLGIGKVFLERKEFEKSLRYLKKAEELSSGDASILNDIGVVYSYLKNFDMANVYFKKALELWADFPEPYYNIGMLYYNQANVDKARSYLQRASDLDPDNQKFKSRLDMLN